MLEVTSAGRHFTMEHCDTFASVHPSVCLAKVGIASDRMRLQQFPVAINRLVAAVQRVDGRSDDGETGRGGGGGAEQKAQTPRRAAVEDGLFLAVASEQTSSSPRC